MHRAIFALVAILAACALAAPTPMKALSKRSFKVPVRPRIGITRSPAQELQKAYRKFGWEIIVVNPENPYDGFGPQPSAPAPYATSSYAAYSSQVATFTSAPASATTEGSEAAAATTAATQTASGKAAAQTSSAAGETGEVSASPEENESEYLSPVSIGGQTLNLDFDTGSADLWVFSNSLPSSESSGHTTFDPSKSSTWQTYQGGSWEISYGDGSSASGTVGFDTVKIGGATATKQAVELATSVSGSFVSDTNNDGLVGLGFSTINTVKPEQQKTFFANIQGALAQPVFTANLEDNASGTYTFGEIDASEYTGSINYTAVDNSQGFWQFSSDSYSVGGTKSACTTCSPAIADTGTSLVLVDDDIVQAYYSQVEGASYSSYQSGYIFSCDITPPSFGIAIGDNIATIPGSGISFAPLGDGTCFGGIQSNQGMGLQILGDVFLKQFLAVFDGGAVRFGVADKA